MENFNLEKFTLAVIRELEKPVSDEKEKYLFGETEKHSLDCGFVYDLVEDGVVKCFELDERGNMIIKYSFLLHDIGKRGMNIDYSEKIDRGSDKWKEMRKHPLLGFEMLNEKRAELKRRGLEENGRAGLELDDLGDIILHHHEHYDGSGYPYGLKGENISVYSRIVGFVESSEAMLHNRRYRGDKMILSMEEYFDEIKKSSGKQFDSRLVDIFLRIVDDKERLELLKNFPRVNEGMKVI